jgi:hypothetical protein
MKFRHKYLTFWFRYTRRTYASSILWSNSSTTAQSQTGIYLQSLQIFDRTTGNINQLKALATSIENYL